MNITRDLVRLKSLLKGTDKKRSDIQELTLAIERSMYQKTHFMGSDRSTIDDDVYLLVFAQQFRPMRIRGIMTKNSYCAYRGLEAPLRLTKSTGLPAPSNSYQSNLDHIIPRSV